MNSIEVQVSDLITDTQDRLGPGCDEDALAQALVEKFDIRPLRASPTEGEAVAWRYQHKEGWGDIWRLSPIRNPYFETPADWNIEPLYAAPPRAAVSPPQREEAIALADDYQRGLAKMEAAGYEEFVGVIPKHKLIIKALRALALYPAGDGREAASLSGEKSK